MHTYVTKRGDSLRSVAAKFDSGPERLAVLNEIDEREGLAVGQRLRIPVRILWRRTREGESPESIARSLQVSPEHIVRLEDGRLIALF